MSTFVCLLAQFLPQDRVAAFALMKPGQLLMESERAMGDARLHKLHLELIEDRNTLKTYERVCALLCSAPVLACIGVRKLLVFGPPSMFRGIALHCAGMQWLAMRIGMGALAASRMQNQQASHACALARRCVEGGRQKAIMLNSGTLFQLLC